jgi:hypothetical protein
MTSITKTKPNLRTGPAELIIIVGLAAGLSATVVFGGAFAIFAVIGAVGFAVFVRYPVVGLYVSTVLLLVGGASANLGVFNLDIPASLGKLAAAVAIPAWLINTVLYRKPVVMTWELVFLGGFMGWSLLGVVYAETYATQWGEWLRLANIAAYLVFTVHVLNTRERIHTYTLVLLACAMLMSLYAIFQYVNPNLQVQGDAGLAAVGAGEEKAYIDSEGIEGGAAVRVSGRTGHSNWLAFTLVMLLPLNVYWLTATKSVRMRMLIGLAVIVELAALVFTFTRMGALVGSIVVLFLMIKQLVRLTPERIGVLAILAIVSFTVLPSAYKERVFSFADNPEMKSTEARITLQEYAWGYAQDDPFIGVGVSGFGLRFVNEDHWLAAHLRWLIKERNWEALYYGPHNLYLQLAAETGFPGLILLIGLVVVLMMRLQRTQSALRGLEELDLARLAGLLQVSLLAFLCCGVFLHALHQKIWWMVIALAIALCYHQRHVIGERPRKTAQP